MHMERDRKKVDNLFTSNLVGYKTEPSDQVWTGIEKRYFGRGTGFFALFLKVLPFLLVIGSGIAVYSIFFTPEDISKTTDDPVAREEAVLQFPEQEIASGVSSAASSDLIEQQTTETIAPSNVISEKPGPGNIDHGSSSTMETQILSDEEPQMPSTEEPAIFMAAEPVRADIDVIHDQFSISCKQITYQPADAFLTKTIVTESRKSYDVAMEYQLNNDYLRKSEYWLGAQITPSVVFYPGKNNKNSWSGEVTMDYVPSRFTFQAGLGLGYYEESGEYQVAYSSFDSIGYYYDVASFSIHPEYPDSVVFDLTETNIFDTVDHIVLNEIQNRYLYLRIPINVGYNVFNTKRLSCYVRAGVVFSILTWKDEPEIIMPVNDIDLISVEQTYPGRNSTSWQFTLGVSFMYQFSKRVGLSIEPVYMKYFGNLYKPGYDYSSTKPYAIGLRTGIYVKF